VRASLFAIALVLVAAPLSNAHAQRRERYKIGTEELATYGDQLLSDVIAKARPQFYQVGTSNGASLSASGDVSGGDGRCMDLGCQQTHLLVYIGSQRKGDSTELHYIRSSDVKEVRFYKPNEAMTRVGAQNAYVIQIIMKDAVAP